MKKVRIVGTGLTQLGRLGKSATVLAMDALDLALRDAGITRADLDGLIAVPSLSNPHFMQAHYLATAAGLVPRKRMVLRTIDTGGAGPVSSLAAAKNMIEQEWAEVIAVVASDAVLSLGKGVHHRCTHTNNVICMR